MEFGPFKDPRIKIGNWEELKTGVPSKDWRETLGEIIAENRQYLQPLGEIHMTLDTWNAIKVAAVSGTMMRYGVGILAGALVGAFAAYRWEIRR